MKTRFLITLSCLLILSSFTLSAIACCDPPCQSCESCEDSACVSYGDCEGGCPDCESCEDCYCECAEECCSDSDCGNPACWDCVDCECECNEECCGHSDCSPCENCTGCECECAEECCEDSDCGDPACWDCDNCECECDVDINSVSSDKDYACVGCDVEFTADLLSGGCSCVDWSGGGDPATANGTCTFTTHWDSSGTPTVTATPDCGSSEQKQVTIAAPTNFRETYREDLGNGVLYFEYMWDSTSGNLAHLSGCYVGEKVDYPGSNDPYCFPSPWTHCCDNPTIIDIDATNGGFADTHYPGSFSTPYQTASVPATQIYRYKSCTGNYTTLMGPISINRYVTGEDELWRYSILKSGAYAEIFPLP